MVNRLAIAFLLAGAALAAPVEKVVTVDPAARFQTFEGWGTSLCWWANVAGAFSQETRDALARQIFTLDDGGLGLNIVRFNIGGGENPGLFNTMEPRARMEGYWPAPDQDFNWDADATQRGVLEDAIRFARASGNDLRFEVFANSPPWWMTVSGSATGRTGADGKPADNLAPEHYGNFANYLLRVTQFLEQRYNIRVETVSPFNEPTSDWWKYGGRQEGCHFTPQSMADFLAVLGPALDGTAYRIAAPEDWSLAQSLTSWTAFGQEIRARVGRINTHTYSGTQRSALFARAGREGRTVWASEYGDGDKSGMKLAGTILQDLQYLGAAAWVNWQVVSPGDWGMIVNDHVREDWQRGKKFYVMGQFSRFVRPGFAIIGVDDSGTLAAYNADQNQLVLVATNFSTNAAQVTFDLSRFSGTGETVQWYQTEVLKTGGDELAAKQPIPVSGGKFAAELAPASLATFIVPVVPSAGDASFSGSGIYRLRNQATGLYAAVSGDDDPDRPGARLRLVDAAAAQEFRVDAVSGGFFRLVNRYSGHDVNVNGASRNAGASVIQWWDGNIGQTAANSQWTPEPDGNGAYRLKARHSGLYLDVERTGETAPAAGAGLIQAPAGSGTELWLVERSAPASGAAPPEMLRKPLRSRARAR